MNAISLFLSILVFSTQQTGDRCICKGEEISLGEIHRSYKTQYGDSKGHGFIKDMEFDSVGILSVSCLLETHFPIMGMEKNPTLKIDTIGGRLNYHGYLVEQPEYVWRENVLRGHLSVLYVVKDEYKEEFDAILDSISITMVANKE